MATIENEIASWTASRAPWQQGVLRLLAAGHVFDESEIDAIATQLVASKQQPSSALKATDIAVARPAGAAVSLRCIREAANVNALVGAQELTFGDAGLTVVYGDNGSGKSGYARIIKDSVGARHREPVHGNVFADSAGQPQKALIEFFDGNAARSSEWPSHVAPELRRVRFYDEACGDTYIGGESELTYRPSALLILDRLIATCDAIAEVLAERLRDNQLARCALTPVPDGTEAKRFLATLSGRTTDAELDAACLLPRDADERLAGLIQEEARLRATDPSKERARVEDLASKLERISTHVSKLAVALDDEKTQEAIASRKEAIELRAAATVASSQTFETEPVAGVGAETWRALWESARAFSETEAFAGRDFPVTSEDAYCVLCQQELSPVAADRLRRFRAFMQDTTAQRADASEQALTLAMETIQRLDSMPPDVAAQLVEIKASESSLAETTTSWLEDAAARKTALLGYLNGDEDTDIPFLGSSPLIALVARAPELSVHATSIDATQFQESLRVVVAKKNDLEARKALNAQRSELKAEIARLAERAKLEEAKRLTDTSAITRKSTELTDAHVTALVRDRFTRESDRLRLERIELKKTGGQKGKFRHRPSLLGAKAPQPVEEVLSEGEQTALGLAGYLTEAYFDDSRSALVLDDPVTSLDHIRRPHVARRLAQLATDRQVIVFSHDVTFVGELLRAADEEQVSVTERGVQRRGDKMPGLCTDKLPWKAKDVPRRVDELGQDLARIKRERHGWDQETYEKECSDMAGKLSETWERLLSLEVVYPVVDPGTSEVHPKMLKVLARISDGDVREFQQSYGRISGWARRHDKSPSRNYVAPEPDELEREIDALKTWFDRVKKYRN